MKLGTFTAHGRTGIGAVIDDHMVDLSVAAPHLPTEMVTFLGAGEAAMHAARHAIGNDRSSIPLYDVRLEAPILRPPKFLGIGLNYSDHVAEVGSDTPDFHEVGNPHQLDLRTWVNGELRQSSNTRYLIHGFYAQIAIANLELLTQASVVYVRDINRKRTLLSYP